MTASTTAAQVLTWAAEPSGPVPLGPLWDVAALTSPDRNVSDAATQLARRTSARLGAGNPPFGTGGKGIHPRIGPGSIFLAAAAGGRGQANAASLLAQAVPPASRGRTPEDWYDLVARHGVAGPVTAALLTAGGDPGIPATPAGGISEPQASTGGSSAESLPELLIAASPLTAVLYRPPLRALRSGTAKSAFSTAIALLDRPRGREVLGAGLARWSPHPDVLAWRALLLTQLRLSHQELLLDVYVTARTRFGEEWDQRIAWAARQVTSLTGATDPLAVDTLSFWGPLAAIERGTPLARLRPLMAGHDLALSLVRRYRLDQAGAA